MSDATLSSSASFDATKSFQSANAGQTLLTAFKIAQREMRAGVRGFLVFLACLALGVGAIAGVNALSGALVDGISKEGSTILGGDIRFSLIHRQAEPNELAFLEARGDVSQTATMRAMARLPDGSDQTLAELKGVGTNYPLNGAFLLDNGRAIQEALGQQPDGNFGAVAELGLMARLNLKEGDTLQLGTNMVTLTGVIEREPDRLASGVGFGPRLMVSNEALLASGLVQPGSLVRWHYTLQLPENASNDAVKLLIEETEETLPNSGFQTRSRANASPALSQNIERFAQFLTLVGLTALIVGGVGVANAVSNYLEGKRPVIATLKSIGASGSFVFQVYIIQILMLASIAVAIGLVIGSFVPTIAASLLASSLPIDIDTSIKPGALALAAVYGYLMALVFAFWPLAKARDIPPTALFRAFESSGRLPRYTYIIVQAALVALLFGLAIGLSDNWFIAASFSAGTVVSFVLLRLVAAGIMRFARALPRPRSTIWRLAVGNIHRPGAITPSVVLSLGLGLSLLVAIALIDGNLRNQLTSSVADEAPSFFFVDIQNHEIDAFEDVLKEQAPGGTIIRVPMMRGHFTEIGGHDPETMDVPSESRWAMRGDRGITYSEDIPESSVLHEGEWWPKNYSGKPLVSFDEEIARHFGLSIGDTVKVNVLGREIEATVSSTRKIEWQSLSINFVMVFSPNTFAGAPHAHLATLTYNGETEQTQEFALMKSLASSFPTVTIVRVKDALERVAEVVGQLAWAIRGASAVTLITSVLVLAGALAAGHRTQIYDAVVLKTLGATKRQLLSAYLLQFTLLGLITAFFGILAGTGASWFVITQIMDGEFIFLTLTAANATAIALFLCIGLGLVGTWHILGQKPAPHLRDL